MKTWKAWNWAWEWLSTAPKSLCIPHCWLLGMARLLQAARWLASWWFWPRDESKMSSKFRPVFQGIRRFHSVCHYRNHTKHLHFSISAVMLPSSSTHIDLEVRFGPPFRSARLHDIFSPLSKVRINAGLLQNRLGSARTSAPLFPFQKRSCGRMEVQGHKPTADSNCCKHLAANQQLSNSIWSSCTDLFYWYRSCPDLDRTWELLAALPFSPDIIAGWQRSTSSKLKLKQPHMISMNP